MTDGNPARAGWSALWLVGASLVFLLVPPFILRRRLVR